MDIAYGVVLLQALEKAALLITRRGLFPVSCSTAAVALGHLVYVLAAAAV
jgi:hypothetical protein